MFLLAGSVLVRLQSSAQFVTQPGDIALTVVLGYPLSQHIPCILENNSYLQVGWELKNQSVGRLGISTNQVIYYKNMFAFKKNNNNTAVMFDYSLILKTSLPSETQLRCYVMYPNTSISHSSWSNINYTGRIEGEGCVDLYKSLAFIKHDTFICKRTF